jgi:hypothetical protein
MKKRRLGGLFEETAGDALTDVHVMEVRMPVRC